MTPSKPRILIVDDDPAVRRLLRRLLTGHGYQVSEAADGDAALEAYAAAPSDVVVTDLMMPGREGLDTIQEFRRRDPRVRIVAMSGGAYSSDALGDYLDAAKEFGAVRIIAKPFSPEDLLSVVADALAQNRLS